MVALFYGDCYNPSQQAAYGGTDAGSRGPFSFASEVSMSRPQALLALSMKGGVGKTTTAIGLARALQRRGHRTGLLDVDIHGSALPRALHLARDPGYEPLVGARLRPVNTDGFQIFSIGLLFREETPNMWDGAMKASAVKQIVTTSIAWDEGLEWIVVDTPPTSGDEVQSLLEHLPNIYGCVIVTQPNDLSLLGITKTLNMLREAEAPVCGLLANMAGYTCPHCGQKSNPFDRESVDVERLAEEYEVPYLGQVPPRRSQPG
ncbi:MAG: ATP-binding protein [Dehalococcoidia bacterium]|nr:ATP-binding protein [Dehalococcoidia bacterium]